MSIVMRYNKRDWKEEISKPVNTLQLFITNRCNMSCKDCFFRHRLGCQDMSMREYLDNLITHASKIKKVVILGGEPTLHPELANMLWYNHFLGLRTTIYTNGHNLDQLKGLPFKVNILIDPKFDLEKIKKIDFNLPVTIVFMLRVSNKDNLLSFAKEIESLGCKKFFISSIRDIHLSGDYWEDTADTIPLDEYAFIVQDFLDNYDGKMDIHISRRGVLTTEKIMTTREQPFCRFGNVFANGDKIICPFDIAKDIKVSELSFDTRPCNKCRVEGSPNCILQKIVLKRR